jgi:cytoskeleton protein RodZ
MSGPVSVQPGGQTVTGPVAPRPSAGAQLRAVREAAQLTVDDVAQQLKLARRQVIAIENDDVDALPGPTFVRGFIRNYARLLRIDAAPLLEATSPPAPPTAPIQQLAPTMGELPLETGSGQRWTRWLIPSGLVLVLIAGIAYYEFSGVSPPGRKGKKEAAEAIVAPPAVAPEPPAPAGTAVATDPAPAGALVGSVAQPATAAPQVVPQTVPQAAPPAAPREQDAAGAPGRLDMEFAGPSWVEIRDAHGEILLSRTLSSKNRLTLTGALPLSVHLGNARAVRLQFNGSPIDLAPYTRAEIARLTLPLPRP